MTTATMRSGHDPCGIHWLASASGLPAIVTPAAAADDDCPAALEVMTTLLARIRDVYWQFPVASALRANGRTRASVCSHCGSIDAQRVACESAGVRLTGSLCPRCGERGWRAGGANASFACDAPADTVVHAGESASVDAQLTSAHEARCVVGFTLAEVRFKEISVMVEPRVLHLSPDRPATIRIPIRDVDPSTTPGQNLGYLIAMTGSEVHVVPCYVDVRPPRPGR